jgi:hypothetical protein
MKSIERRFENIKKKDNGWTSYICFAQTVSGQSFSEKIIRRYFNKLVDKNDYLSAEKKEIINYLLTLTKSS